MSARWLRRMSFGTVLASLWIAVLVAVAVLAAWLPIEHYESIVGPARQAPGWRWPEPLGTDGLGRSTLSRVVYGARVSLLLGVGAAAAAMVLGGLAGMCAGYFRGAVDRVVSTFVDSALAFPPLILLLALTSVLQQTLPTLVLALTLLIVPTFARLARASTLTFAEREFVLAARTMGMRHGRILLRELLPNVVPPVSSYAFIMIATVIVAEGSLSFLGLGIPPPQPSWGGMIARGRENLQTDPHLVFVPGIVMLVTILAFNVLGDHLRGRFYVRDSALA